jgi:prepilin-type N-terminal cleavage/methylation domain-containing protein
MIKNLRKRGFTIVELVIVIAVIAILAAILIPTFSGIIKKANIASDTAMAKNMNTALVMADSEGNVPEDMGDVLFILYGAGYVLENLNPTTNGYYFVWDETTNQILFLTDTFEVHYSSKAYSEDTLNWWLPIDEASDVTEIEAIGAKVSYCMAKDIEGDLNFTYLANFDTNGFTLEGDISYVSDATGSFSVSGIIEGTLLVNAPNANVSHYGAVENVNIVEVSQTSYHEYGFVKVSLELQKGRLVIENTGNATTVVLPVSTNGTAENKGYIGTLSGKTEGTNVKLNNSGFVEQLGSNAGGFHESSSNGKVGAPTGFAILIENLNQLEAFRDAVNFGMTCEGLTVKLMSDIDISNRYWVPIGYNNKYLAIREGDGETTTPANVFMGTFDGNNKTIKGLTNLGYIAPQITFVTNVSNIHGYVYGLFSVTYDAVVQNLNMTDVNIVLTAFDSACVGAIIGVSRGSVTVKDCSVKGNISGVDGVGGAVGYVYAVMNTKTVSDPKYIADNDQGKDIIFENVTVEGDIYASNQRAGGIIGANLVYNVFALSESATLYNTFSMTGCSFKGSVKATNTRAGGLFVNSSGGTWLYEEKVDSVVTIVGFPDEHINKNGCIIQNNSVEGSVTASDRVGRFFGQGSNVVDYSPLNDTVNNNTFTGHVYAGSPLSDITDDFGENTN